MWILYRNSSLNNHSCSLHIHNNNILNSREVTRLVLVLPFISNLIKECLCWIFSKATAPFRVRFLLHKFLRRRIRWAIREWFLQNGESRKLTLVSNVRTKNCNDSSTNSRVSSMHSIASRGLRIYKRLNSLIRKYSTQTIFFSLRVHPLLELKQNSQNFSDLFDEIYEFKGKTEEEKKK